MNKTLKNLFVLFLNSLLAYVLSYLIILIFSQLVVFISAKTFGIPVNLNHFKITFPVADQSRLWNQNSVVGIYLTAPVLVLIFGFASRLFKYYLESENRPVNLILSWVYAHAMNIFFGGLIVGIPLVKGFGYVPVWLYFPFFVQLLIIATAVFIIYFNANYLGKSFVSLTFSDYYLKNYYSQLALKIFIVILPCLFANSLFFLLKFPDNSLYESLLLLTMFIQIAGTIPFSYIHISIHEQNSHVYLSKKMLFVLLAMVIIIVFVKIISNG